MDSGLRDSGRQCIVPLRVSLWMAEAQFLHLRLRDFNTSLVLCCVENGVHFQAGLGLRSADQVHNGFIVQ